MPLMFHNGKPLFADGKPAMSESCCCDCLRSPETVEFTIEYGLSSETGYEKDLTSVLCADLQSHRVPSVYSFSFAADGATTTLSSLGNTALPGGDCGLNMSPYLSISASSSGEMFVYTFHAVLVRKGVLSVSFKPNADTFATIIAGECVDENPTTHLPEPKYLRATPSLTIGGIPGVTSHNPGWDSNNEVYTTPFTNNWNF